MLDFLGVNRVRDERGGQSSLFDGRRWSEEDREAVQAHIQNFYDMFLERVAEGRNMTPEEVDEIGRGRLWSGARAVDVGLADSTAGFAGAYDALLDELELDHSDRIELVHYPRARLSLFGMLPSLPAFRSQTQSDLARLAESLGANVALRWLAPWIWTAPGEAMAVTEWAFEGI
jgi:protease-4